MTARGRFAPSTTGRAHPGTLLAALLCWLDARSRGGEVVLRLEDLDRGRTKPGYVEAIERDLAWLGLEWDARVLQSERSEAHETAIDRLVRAGRVYACDCSRSQIRASGRLAPDGSHAYPGRCRANSIAGDDWRRDPRSLRLRLESRTTVFRDESGERFSGDATQLFGDPLLRRRDGAYAYHFVSVLDDAAASIDRVVRGRDLAASTLVQLALQRELDLPTPSYRHHCLLLERRGAKLAKLHGAVGCDALRARYSAEELCGRLASFVGLAPSGLACRPTELVEAFDWAKVSREDVVLDWTEAGGLESVEAATKGAARP